MSSHLQIIAELETVTEIQAKAIRVLATRLAELGDTETGRNEIAEPIRHTVRPSAEPIGWADTQKTRECTSTRTLSSRRQAY